VFPFINSQVEEGKPELKIQVCHDVTHVAYALVTIVNEQM
jgi:hypothetical protein